ncbi:MAG: hypothetical protein Q8L95_02275 [Burkholderiales bacterium]|nr:hypothetical protein [Burkholderiales bacterium]
MTANKVFTVLALCSALCTSASAQTFAEKCKSWIDKKGYSTDYIETKTGKRQPGLAPQWKGNIEPADVQVGDVVFTYVPNSTTAQRVAMVDEVELKDGKAIAVIYSEWNQGNRFTDRDCLVTDKFGLPTSGRLPVAAILRAWRPSLPLQ